jgi:hypothetical protein
MRWGSSPEYPPPASRKRAPGDALSAGRSAQLLISAHRKETMSNSASQQWPQAGQVEADL